MKSRMLILFISFVSIAVSGCGGSSGTASTSSAKRGTLVSITSSSTLGASVINNYISTLKNTYGVNTSVLNGSKYDISIQRIVYKTIAPDGRLIDVSGVLAYPLKAAGARSPLLSYQHGTIFQDSEAPSIRSYANPDPVMTVMAGSGFIVAMPDYIGYAASTNEIHTNVNAHSLAATTVDMLRATRQLLAEKNILTNEQLFLAGYSEGGYATLATQKEIEQNLAGEFNITASMPGAGSYDMSATAQYLVGLATIPYPEIVGFVFKSYDYWYNWNSINSAFQSPYSNIIATGFDGSMNQASLHAALTTDSATLFNSTFRSDFLGSGQTILKTDIAKNDIYNWAPTTPTHLFHGQDDTVVPYANTTSADMAMKAAGSTSTTIVNCTTSGSLLRDHTGCFWDYLSQGLAWIVPMATNL